MKSNVGGNFWSNVLAGDRSVGVRRAEVVEIGDKSGEVGEWMKSLLILGGLSLLAIEFVWARRLLRKVKLKSAELGRAIFDSHEK